MPTSAERHVNRAENAGHDDADGDDQGLPAHRLDALAPCADVREVALHFQHRLVVTGIDAHGQEQLAHGSIRRSGCDVLNFRVVERDHAVHLHRSMSNPLRAPIRQASRSA